MANAKTADPPTTRRRSVLLAEDSSVTQDLVRLILDQRGHSIDIFADGETALEALLARDYDVALLDFHLPGISGLDVVTRFQKAGTGRRPVFIAVTGDAKGLLRDQANCELFDLIAPKPLDIDYLIEVVEAERDPLLLEDPVQPSRAGAHVGRSPYERLERAALIWPDQEARLPIGAGFYEYEVVIVRRAERLARLWSLRGAHLLPVLDETGLLGPMADHTPGEGGAVDWRSLDEMIDAFLDRRSEIHADIVRSDDAGDKLLGRMKVAGGELSPCLTPSHRGLYAYNALPQPALVAAEIEKLAARGMATPFFHDRTHCCAGCGGARFNVRETCPRCRSANLDEESYLHHFRCAAQGPERDFRDGDDLVCPKCRRTLHHFGEDYDRPGVMLVCNACGDSFTEPSVGFLCVDCGRTGDGDGMAVTDIVGARITAEGEAYLKAGREYLGDAQKALRLADLPLDLVVALNRAARAYNMSNVPFFLAALSYQRAEELADRLGPRGYAAIRRQLVEGLRQRLGDQVEIVSGAADFALGFEIDPNVGARMLEAAIRDATGDLAEDPDARVTVFGAEDLAG